MLLLGGCNAYYVSSAYVDGQKEIIPLLEKYKYIYIQNLSRSSGLPGIDAFKRSFKKFAYYKVLDRIDIDFSTLKETLILDYKATFQKFWEVEIDPLAKINKDPQKKEVILVEGLVGDPKIYPTILSNAILKFRFKLIDAASKKIIFETPAVVSFQQVYSGKNSISSRPDARIEFDRLSKLAFDRFAEQLDFNKTLRNTSFEVGQSKDFWRNFLPLTVGNATIVKGIRFAQGKNWRNALTTWLVSSYDPDFKIVTTEDELIFSQNRASSYYNMGQVYSLLGRYEDAALMYAYANQTLPRTHYAQSWSDAIVKQSKSNNERFIDLDIVKYENEKIGVKVLTDLKIIDSFPALKRSILWPDE